MKKTLLIISLIFLSALNLNADSANRFCGGDQDNYSNMVNCYINQIDDCRDAYPTCAFNSFALTPGDVISTLIDKCCTKSGDEAQDACFLKHVRTLGRARGAINKKFRRDVSKRIKAYINDAELQCTEA